MLKSQYKTNEPIPENTREPTVKEGADFIERCVSREYKFYCIRVWREWFGDDLAERVMQELRSRRKGRRMQEPRSRRKGRRNKNGI